MIKYNNTNNASTTLTAWISASSTTLIVENGDILPTAPFLLTLEHFDNEKVTVREIVKCIAKAWNILTIQRGAWTCVQDDSATPKAQNNTPHSFSVWDVASIYWTSEQVQDIQNEIEKKLNIDDFQAWTYVYGATSTETDAYSITIPWTLTSYSVGQVFRFMADVDNEWNATLNINGLWAVEIRKNHDKNLDNGDIEAWQIVEVAYDWTYFQMDSQVATVVSVVGMGNTQTMVIPAYETLQSKDWCTAIDTSTYNFWKNELWRLWDTVTSEIYWNWEQSTDSFSIKIQRVWSDLSWTLHAQILDWEDVLYSTSVPRYEISDTVQNLTLNFWTIQLVYLKEYTLKLYTDTTDAENYYIINNQGDLVYKSIFEYPTEVVSWTWDWGTNFPIRSDTTLLTTCSWCWLSASFDRPATTYRTNTLYLTFTKNDSSFTVKISHYNWSSSGYSSTVTLSVDWWTEETILSVSAWYWDRGYSIDLKNWAILYKSTKYDIEIPFTDYTSITTRVAVDNTSGGANIWLSEPQIIPINVVSDSVQNKRAKKIAAAWDIKWILVCQSPVQAKQEWIFEIWGMSSVFKDWTGYLYQQTDWSISSTSSSYRIWMYDAFWNFKYKKKFNLSLPTQNTDFTLSYDAVMVVNFTSTIQSWTVKYSITQDWSDYKIIEHWHNWGYTWNGEVLNETVEWKLEWWHTYKISFANTAIKEFYLVD